MVTNKTDNMNGLVHIGDAVNRSLELAECGQRTLGGIPSGFPSLDRLTRGWNPGELIIIGGRPCVGMTALALGMARNAAVEFGIPTVYYSLELSTVMLTDRLIVSEADIPIGKLHGEDRLRSEEWPRIESSIGKLSNAPLFLDDTPGLTVDQFERSIRGLSAQKGVKLAIVDSLQPMSPDEDSYLPDDRTRERKEILHRLRNTATDLGIALIVLSYLRRPLRWHYSGPILTDLDAYCPDADECADKIILMNRPSLFSQVESTEDRLDPIQLRIVQNRNGRDGMVELLFDKDRIRMVEPMDFYGIGLSRLEERRLER